MSNVRALLGNRATTFADRAAWLANRIDGIGASEIAPILGQSPHRGPWDVYAAKRDGLTVEDEDTAPDEEDAHAAVDIQDPLVRGNRWESRIREDFAAIIGRPVLAPGEPWGQPTALVHVRHRLPALRWAACSPDGWLVEEDGLTVPVELKSDAGRRGYGWGVSGTQIVRYIGADDTPINGALGWPDVSPHYYLQVLWQMAVLEAPHCYIAVMLGSYRLRWFRVCRDADHERRVINAVAAWRARHLVEGVEPDADGSDACVRHYTTKWKGLALGERAATLEETPLVKAFGLARAARKAAETAAAEAKGRLLPVIGDASKLTLPGGRGVTRNRAGAVSAYGF